MGPSIGSGVVVVVGFGRGVGVQCPALDECCEGFNWACREIVWGSRGTGGVAVAVCVGRRGSGCCWAAGGGRRRRGGGGGGGRGIRPRLPLVVYVDEDSKLCLALCGHQVVGAVGKQVLVVLRIASFDHNMREGDGSDGGAARRSIWMVV